MAYSDYGAYIWKNGKNITKQYADKEYIFFQDKWYESDLLEDVDKDKCVRADGHAVLVFDNFAIEFYKVYNPKIIVANTAKEIKTAVVESYNVSNPKDYINKKLNLKITGYYIDSDHTIIKYDITHKEDSYCVIIGGGFGNGYDSNHTSKFIRKNLVYNQSERRLDYHIEHKWVDRTDTWVVLDYLERKDEINYEKYCRWNFGYTVLFNDLIHFRFNYIIGDLNQILKYNTKIKMLK